ncbi:MAG: glycoside hydrolase family 78 protein [Candidatus Omnitrophica bacterium]|nr:glycoside hydrolase family 78 protein [Candidatus Omnitrophota bacterium]
MFENARWIWLSTGKREILQTCYFRKKFFSEKQTIALVHCCADSRYRLWVNGKYIGFGPARGKATSPYYDTHRVQIKNGENVIAFFVQHYFKPSKLYESVEPGLICQVEAGGKVLLETDKTWKAKEAVAYSPVSGIFFPECFDARIEEQNWYMPEFDDRSWENVIEKIKTELAQPDELIPRPIPLIREKKIIPEKILRLYRCQVENNQDFLDKEKIAETLWYAKIESEEVKTSPQINAPCGWKSFSLNLEPNTAVCFIVDFGFETLAFIEFSIQGNSGTIVDFAHSECLWNNRVATMWQSPSLKQPGRIILKDGKTIYKTNQPHGFRYMVVRVFNQKEEPINLSIDSIAAYEAIYPVKKQGSFESSDNLLNQIYELSARTVNLCMEDSYTDCPWRERSQWIGDMQPECLFNYYCFGAYELSKKAVLEITSSNTEEGWIPGVAPGLFKSNLPTWGMRIPVIVWEYYLFTEDFETLKKAYDGVKKQMDWLLAHTEKNGFFDLKCGWNFVDWTRLDDRHADGAVQGWFYESLIYAEKIAKEMGDLQSAKVYKKHAEILKKSIERYYWGTKAFKKYRKNSPVKPVDVAENIIGQHENFLFNLLEIGSAQQRKMALQSIAGKTGFYLPNLGDYQSAFLPEHKGNYIGEEIIKIGSPFWSFYALLSLCKANKYLEAINYIRICWGLILEFGATSCWEMWDRHTSLCHGWSAAPAMILPAYVLGVKPVEPGFKKFLIGPILFDLEWAKGTVPTPSGQIFVSWKKEKRFFEISVEIPENLTGILVVPEGFGPQKKIVLKSGKNKFSFKRRKS